MCKILDNTLLLLVSLSHELFHTFYNLHLSERNANSIINNRIF